MSPSLRPCPCAAPCPAKPAAVSDWGLPPWGSAGGPGPCAPRGAGCRGLLEPAVLRGELAPDGGAVGSLGRGGGGVPVPGSVAVPGSVPAAVLLRQVLPCSVWCRGAGGPVRLSLHPPSAGYCLRAGMAVAQPPGPGRWDPQVRAAQGAAETEQEPREKHPAGEDVLNCGCPSHWHVPPESCQGRGGKGETGEMGPCPHEPRLC